MLWSLRTSVTWPPNNPNLLPPCSEVGGITAVLLLFGGLRLQWAYNNCRTDRSTPANFIDDYDQYYIGIIVIP